MYHKELSTAYGRKLESHGITKTDLSTTHQDRYVMLFETMSRHNIRIKPSPENTRPVDWA